MTPGIRFIFSLLEGLEINSTEEQRFYDALRSFVSSFEPFHLSAVNRLYLNLDAGEQLRAWEVCQMVYRNLPDVVIKEEYHSVVSRWR